MADPYAPLLARDKLTSHFALLPGPANMLSSALAQLEPLLAALRKNHLALKEQNQKIMETGTRMSMSLVPIEDGIRIAREEKLAKEDDGSQVPDGGLA